MNRQAMCVAIVVLLCLGVGLYVCGHALDSVATYDKKVDSKDQLALQRAAQWCKNLAKVSAVVTLLLVLCCQCCQGVEFKGLARGSSGGSGGSGGSHSVAYE